MRSKVIDRHLCKTVHGGRFVPIPGFPGEKIDRRLLPDIRWMERRYDIFITDGYSTDPVHAGNGEHPIGLATDIVPNRAKGGTWNEIGEPSHRKAEPRQDQPIPPWRWVGLERRSGPRPRQPPPPLLDALSEPSPGIRPASSTRASARPRPTSPRPPIPAPSRSRRRAAPRRPAPGTGPAGPPAGSHRLVAPQAGGQAGAGGPRGPLIRRGAARRPSSGRTVRPAFESSPRALASWLARARLIRGTCPLPLKAASFRT